MQSHGHNEHIAPLNLLNIFRFSGYCGDSKPPCNANVCRRHAHTYISARKSRQQPPPPLFIHRKICSSLYHNRTDRQIGPKKLQNFTTVASRVFLESYFGQRFSKVDEPFYQKNLPSYTYTFFCFVELRCDWVEFFFKTAARLLRSTAVWTCVKDCLSAGG